MLSLLKTDFKIAFILSVFAAVICTPAWTADSPVLYKGVIAAFKLNIREHPSRSADVVVVLERETSVDVVEKQGGIGGWLKVVYKGQQGWIRNRPQYIRLIPVKASDALANKTTLQKKAATVKKQEPVKKQDIVEKLETQEKMVQAFSQKEMEIIEGLNEIDYALNKARVKMAALSQENDQLAARIHDLSEKRRKVAEQIRISRGYAAGRLKALYKMNMIGRIEAAGLPGSVFDFIVHQDAMKRIIASDFQVIDMQAKDLERFNSLEKELKDEMAAKKNLEAELDDQIRINNKEGLKRELILKEIRKKKKLSLAAVESLRTAAIQLDNRVNSLEAGQSAMPDAASFASHKGSLIPPVKGEIISSFGPSGSADYKSFTFQKGIDIKVERGEPVKSVFKGEVMFAQWLKGYGNLLIINHGDNYYTLYAHVEEVFKQKGERVETGEVIATAGDTGSIKGMCLHFEVRHHGKPVNPMNWLRKGA
jgi:septal ring factor EnvC (AmiA/AmiB activator)